MKSETIPLGRGPSTSLHTCLGAASVHTPPTIVPLKYPLGWRSVRWRRPLPRHSDTVVRARHNHRCPGLALRRVRSRRLGFPPRASINVVTGFGGRPAPALVRHSAGAVASPSPDRSRRPPYPPRGKRRASSRWCSSSAAGTPDDRSSRRRLRARATRCARRGCFSQLLPSLLRPRRASAAAARIRD